MYKLTDTTSILRLSDGAMIPADLRNTDYKEYLRWIAAGGVVLQPDPPTNMEVSADNYKGMIRRRAEKLSPIDAVLLLKTIGE
jgi:hypothetical protein